MGKDNISLDIKGHLLIKAGDQVLFDGENEILPGAKTILAGCLSNLNGNNQIDKITLIGDFGEIDYPIIKVKDPAGSTAIRFTAEIGEGNVSGNINFMVLNSTNKGPFSRKQLTNVYKDNNIMLTIEWTINII